MERDKKAAVHRAIAIDDLGAPRQLPEVAPHAARPPAIRAGWRIERSSFVGRTTQVRELRAYLEDGARLLTIFGAPGLGKTRLLRRIGGLLADEGCSVEFCDLTAAATLGEVVAVVARALGVPLVYGATAEEASLQLGKAIASRGRLILLHDNFEQVVAHAQATLGAWLDAAPLARFLVASRETLGLEEEVRFELPPLDLDEGIRLFEDRAQMDRSSVPWSAPDQAAVADIVRKLDGIPLALELAAARMSVLSPCELLSRLDARFKVLRAQRRDVPGRHATLERAIDWSFELLAPWERAVFGQCAVFRGGFSLDAAEAVLSVEGFTEAPPVLDVLQALRHKSLVRRYTPAGSSAGARFGLYESLREYADRTLDDANRCEVEARYSRYYVAEAERWAAQVSGPASRNALSLLRFESDNLIQIAHNRRIDPTLALRAALALDVLLLREGPLSVRRSVLDAVADAAESTASAADAVRYYRARADMERMSLHLVEAMEILGVALAIARRAADPVAEAGILVSLGDIEATIKSNDSARAHFQEAAAIAQRHGDRVAVAAALYGVDGSEGTSLEEVLALLRSMKDLHARALALQSVGGRLCTLSCEHGRAAPVMREASSAARAAGDAMLGEWMDTSACGLALAAGSTERALDELKDLYARHRALGDPWGESIARFFLGPLLLAAGRVSEARAVLREWVTQSAAAGYHWGEGFASAHLGALEAERGDISLAEEYFGVAQMRADAVRVEFLGSSVDLLRGVLDIARARAAVANGQADVARSHHASARRRLSCSMSDARTPELSDVLARRVLERVLSEYESPTDTARAPAGSFESEAPQATPAAPTLDFELATDGRWFRTPKAGLVSLGRRQAMRRILIRLMEQRFAAPGAPLSTPTLIEVGWPGERIQPSAAQNRFYNAMAVLRSLGLREVLINSYDGYTIDPELSVGWGNPVS